MAAAVQEFRAKLDILKSDEEIKKTEAEKAKRTYEIISTQVITATADGTITNDIVDRQILLREDYRKKVLVYRAAVNNVKCFALQDPSTDEGTSHHKERTLAFYAKIDAVDNVNEGSTDGSLIPLNTLVQSEGYIPGHIAPDVDLARFRKACEVIADVNGRPFYDAERNALGFIPQAEYLLLPQDYPVPVCPVEYIGKGLEYYNLDIETIVGIYGLAKEQAKSLGYEETKQRKWALMRLEAVKCGWFDHQKYTKYVPMKNDFSKIFYGDADFIDDNCDHAAALAIFIPLMNEYHFRNFNSMFTSGNAAAFVKRARSIAKAMRNPNILEFADSESLFGNCWRWIGVKRQMEFLRFKEGNVQVPEPFRVRAVSAPAGRAVISTSWAVINVFKSNGWWEALKTFGGYTEENIEAANNVMIKNPWKYHKLSTVYTTEKLTDDEETLFAKATEDAIALAPMFQAYIDTLAKGGSIGASKALGKYAAQNKQMYVNARNVFKCVRKGMDVHMSDLFKKAFETTEERTARMKALKEIGDIPLKKMKTLRFRTRWRR